MSSLGRHDLAPPGPGNRPPIKMEVREQPRRRRKDGRRLYGAHGAHTEHTRATPPYGLSALDGKVRIGGDARGCAVAVTLWTEAPLLQGSPACRQLTGRFLISSAAAMAEQRCLPDVQHHRRAASWSELPRGVTGSRGHVWHAYRLSLTELMTATGQPASHRHQPFAHRRWLVSHANRAIIDSPRRLNRPPPRLCLSLRPSFPKPAVGGSRRSCCWMARREEQGNQRHLPRRRWPKPCRRKRHEIERKGHCRESAGAARNCTVGGVFISLYHIVGPRSVRRRLQAACHGGLQWRAAACASRRRTPEYEVAPGRCPTTRLARVQWRDVAAPCCSSSS